MACVIRPSCAGACACACAFLRAASCELRTERNTNAGRRDSLVIRHEPRRNARSRILPYRSLANTPGASHLEPLHRDLDDSSIAIQNAAPPTNKQTRNFTGDMCDKGVCRVGMSILEHCSPHLTLYRLAPPVPPVLSLTRYLYVLRALLGCS